MLDTNNNNTTDGGLDLSVDKLIERLEKARKGSVELDRQIYMLLVDVGMQIGMPFNKVAAHYTTDLDAIRDVVQGNNTLYFFVVFGRLEDDPKIHTTTLHFVDFINKERAVSATGSGRTPALALCATLFRAFKTLEIL